MIAKPGLSNGWGWIFTFAWAMNPGMQQCTISYTCMRASCELESSCLLCQGYFELYIVCEVESRSHQSMIKGNLLTNSVNSVCVKSVKSKDQHHKTEKHSIGVLASATCLPSLVSNFNSHSKLSYVQLCVLHIDIHILRYITLNCITLHYITLHWMALHSITRQCSAMQCIACSALHCIALHYIAVQCIALHTYVDVQYTYILIDRQAGGQTGWQTWINK